MRGAPRFVKLAIHRTLGERAYGALQTMYWRERVKRFSYPFEFRQEIEAAVSPGDTVLDIGANVGQYAALLAHIVGPGGRVLAFEPEKNTYAMLAAIMQNPVETFQLALADRSGTVALVRVFDDDGLPNIGLTYIYDADGDVPVATLDSLCADLRLDTCSFVKIDVEGSELMVLRGATMFLSTRRPLLQIELDTDMSARYGYFARRDDQLPQ